MLSLQESLRPVKWYRSGTEDAAGDGAAFCGKQKEPLPDSWQLGAQAAVMNLSPDAEPVTVGSCLLLCQRHPCAHGLSGEPYLQQ